MVSKLKMIVVGDSQCGKSSLLQQFIHGRFEPSRELTVGVDLAFKSMRIADKDIKMQLWDLSGQSTFHNIIRVYYRGAHVILFVYDVTDERSFDHIKNWLDRIQSAWSSDYSPAMILVGCKTDRGCDRVVTREVAEAFARRHDMLFCETSSKTGEGVEDAFLLPAYAFVKAHRSVLEEAEVGLDLTTPEGGEGGIGLTSGCCWG